MKKMFHVTIGVVIGILILTTVFILLNKLDTTVPAVKLKFISFDPLQEQQVEYSYVYEGDDLIRGSKFGGHGYSEVKTAITGQIVEIPSKRIVSYWPFSHFTYLLVNADKKDTQQGDCSWTAGIWTDEYRYLFDDDIQNKETVARYPYNTPHSNEYIFRNVRDKIIEVTCL